MPAVSAAAPADSPPADLDRRDDPRWTRPALAVLLISTAAFWTIGLSRNGWANAFYSAAVQAGTKSWKAFLFGSSDAANSITVDKPPAALWPMELSARIFGVNSWSIQLPQVLLGIASVALLYLIVKKHFGPAAGLIAGALLALTPVATLMFRYNNPDALLVFVMIAAVWALLRTVDTGLTRWIVLCGALLGLGFLTKQLQVLLVVPGLALTYLIAGAPRLRIRLAQLLGGVAAMIAAAGWWVAVVELTPADARPYVGGSSNNSFLDLTFGYNGLGRLTGQGNMPGGVSGPGPGAISGPGMPFAPAGITRMFTGESGGQISWLLPAALILLVVGLLLCARAPRTDPQRAQHLVWGGWLLGTGAVFSFMSGIFHDYYTVALAPAIAALIGIGTTQLWRRRDATWATLTLAGATALTAAWAWILLGRTPDFVPWLRWIILGVGAFAAAALIIAAVLPAAAARSRDIAVWAAALAVAAALAGPLSYCIQTVTTSRTGSVVAAGPSLNRDGFPNPPGATSTSDKTTGGASMPGAPPMEQSEVSGRVVAVLMQNADAYTWIAATNGATDAARYQLATDDPVMPLGGFGFDSSPTLEQFQRYVTEGRIHYYIQSPQRGFPTADSAGLPAPPNGGGGKAESDRIAEWVKQHYTPTEIDGITLYDLTKPTTAG
jgi:4-amino-4-deoxy-L-arabinose transferase-like glycosyltransferase